MKRLKISKMEINKRMQVRMKLNLKMTAKMTVRASVSHDSSSHDSSSEFLPQVSEIDEFLVIYLTYWSFWNGRIEVSELAWFWNGRIFGYILQKFHEEGRVSSSYHSSFYRSSIFSKGLRLRWDKTNFFTPTAALG